MAHEHMTNGVNGVHTSPTPGGSASPQQNVPPKSVAFELLFEADPHYRARLPMRVSIYPHDTTESIVTTVKNFYGLYSGPTGSKGVSFEDEQGTTLIARYENFRNDMTVYVRVTEESPATSGSFSAQSYYTAAPVGAQAYYGNGETYPLPTPQRFGPDISRPTSRTSRRRSPSPNSGRGRRSVSAGTNPALSKKGRSRSSRTRDTSANGHGEGYSESLNGYSSGDGAASATSGRTKDHLGNTEISVENIVEGGRRKRAKFESSELPLFAPPQMPAATSNPSVSPARRIDHHRPSVPFIAPGQNAFTNARLLQSPLTYQNGYGSAGIYATPASDNRRSRGSIGFPGQITGAGGNIIPTPDPTVGSCMSEEDKDVAMQLMRLGDMSNISHGRTSASTLDETFSGRADAASSTGATSDEESESEDGIPPTRRQRLNETGASKKIYPTTETHFMPPRDSADVSADDADYDGVQNSGGKQLQMTAGHMPAKPKIMAPLKTNKPPKAPKAPRPSMPAKIKKPSMVPHGPMSPSSLPGSRKPSSASANGFAGDDDHLDLSTKPRCQRCRKSKKGCDRQRPCGRCQDAGLSADQCISEDEGNGRKGRYGRHMGVPIKKEEVPAAPVPAPALPAFGPPPALLPSAPISAAPDFGLDKNKKRKR